MTVWVVVALTGAGTMALKAAGPMLLGHRPMADRVRRLLELLAPALLSALVVTGALGGPEGIVFDERLVGLAAAAVAVGLRAPLAVVVAAAAVATALVRLI
jgi:branched-subunit amino acid transport protein